MYCDNADFALEKANLVWEPYFKSGRAARGVKACPILTLQFNNATGYLNCKYYFTALRSAKCARPLLSIGKSVIDLLC